MAAVLDVRLAADSADPRSPSASGESIRRVTSFDGRTRVVAVRRGSQWAPVRGTRLTESTAADLWSDGVEELELRRGTQRARISILWLLDWDALSR